MDQWSGSWAVRGRIYLWQNITFKLLWITLPKPHWQSPVWVFVQNMPRAQQQVTCRDGGGTLTYMLIVPTPIVICSMCSEMPILSLHESAVMLLCNIANQHYRYTRRFWKRGAAQTKLILLDLGFGSISFLVQRKQTVLACSVPNLGTWGQRIFNLQYFKK